MKIVGTGRMREESYSTKPDGSFVTTEPGRERSGRTHETAMNHSPLMIVDGSL